MSIKINLEGKYSPLVPFWINFLFCTIIFLTSIDKEKGKEFSSGENRMFLISYKQQCEYV
jgi:hypothetical protein